MTIQAPIPNYDSGGGNSGPAAQVSLPGMILMILGILYILGNLLMLILNLAGVGLGAAAGGDQGMQAMINGTAGIVGAIIGFIFGFVIAFGGMKMRKLQSYGLSMTAAILAMLPCSCCCIIGLPVGIWALVVLMKPEVKAAYR